VAWWRAVDHGRREGRLTPNVVVVGATVNAERFIRTALATGDVNVLGVFDDRADRAPSQVLGVPVLGDTGALIGHRIMPYVDRVIIAVSSTAQARVGQLVERLEVLPNPVSLFVDLNREAQRNASLAHFVDLSGATTDARRAFVKRAQDLMIGSLGLLAAAPVMLLVALAIKLDSPGPVFFRQRRHGFNNEAILVWKFRSMRHDMADAKAVRQISADDDRVTKVGKFIRKTSLDELPQLFNVLRGEMSMVGPRPHAIGMKSGDVESEKLVARYAHRHRMKPGVTGWAAINGSRGPVDTAELVQERVALDIEYIERQSFWLDLYIIAMTIPCLLGDRSAVR
jgi:Undecaprenyl-phosphate glucose phosphotransferase